MKTDFFLNYINDVKFRQRIEKQLNITNSQKQFSLAVVQSLQLRNKISLTTQKDLLKMQSYSGTTCTSQKKLQQAANQKEKDEILSALKNFNSSMSAHKIYLKYMIFRVILSESIV